jgi:hypothetical protein
MRFGEKSRYEMTPTGARTTNGSQILCDESGSSSFTFIPNNEAMSDNGKNKYASTVNLL